MNKFLLNGIALLFLPVTLALKLIRHLSRRSETLRLLNAPLRLFKNEGDNWRFVWIIRNTNGFRVDFGRVGHTSNTQHLPRSAWKTVRSDIEALREKGYCELDAEEWEDLIVTYGTETLDGSANDSRKMATLSRVVGDALAALGHGFSNGYVIQDGLAQARFLVVDAAKAQRCVTSTLSGTDFDDYVCVDVFDEQPEDPLLRPEAA